MRAVIGLIMVVVAMICFPPLFFVLLAWLGLCLIFD
jgi:hypothetical protein